MTLVLSPGSLRAATVPTMYFVGVTTGSSAIHRVFEAWRPLLGLEDVALTGIDVPVGAPAEAYREVVSFLAADPRSRGALVTTHKIDLFTTCRDLLAEVDDDAARLGEISALVAGDGWVRGQALDTVTSALALEAIVPRLSGRTVAVLGAGGAALALCDWFAHRAGDAAPACVHVTDVDAARLAAVVAAGRAGDPAIEWCPHLLERGTVSDELVATLPPGSVVVNATGMGKDRPGSPLSDDVVFPRGGYAWEFNYRGELDFLRQALSRAEADSLVVEDGWRYFVHGWTRAIDAVFDLGIPTSGTVFDRLDEAARAVR
jgi:shikimate 5-dehydrogenase